MKKIKPVILASGAVLALLGAALAAIRLIYTARKESLLASRHKVYYSLTRQWVENCLSGFSSASYFESRSFKSVALYGIGTLGELLYKELNKEGITVCCFIDKDAGSFYDGAGGIPVVGINDFSSYNPDVIIVTPVYDFKEIYKNLSAVNERINIVSIEDVIISSRKPYMS